MNVIPMECKENGHYWWHTSGTVPWWKDWDGTKQTGHSPQGSLWDGPLESLIKECRNQGKKEMFTHS